MSQKFKLLILSVGSLLGQNILDVLARRRERVTVIGTNSQVENPRNFRCDRLYRLPEMRQQEVFGQEFQALLEREQPKLILPGRDDDVVFLADFKANNPSWSNALPCGKVEIARIIRDKFLTYTWATEHHLPFAHSFVYTSSQDRSALNQFIQEAGYPLIAKPRDGFGSRGVYIIPNEKVLQPLLELNNLLFQEYLMPPDDLSEHLKRYTIAPPLFFQIPEQHQYAAQTLISPDGHLHKKYTSVSTMVLGRCERLERIEEPDMQTLLEDYAKVLYQAGWLGPLNIQCKRDRQGQWKVHEINLRMSGGTSARLLTGYDELGHLLNTFYPEFNFPDLSGATPKGVVVRSLTDTFIATQDMQQFAQQGFWSASD